MRLFFVGLVLIAAHAQTVHAQIRTFPYKAVVQAEPAYARSGPGRTYYPTSKLNAGDEVVVHRHDPGGWYMISPPEGSFSWIRAEYVDKTAGNRGVLTANNVIVRVGSAIDNVYDVEQRRLSTGDEVQILGENTFQTERGAVNMYKIAPPPGEYRWVLGKTVVPADEMLREQRNRDPFTSPVPTPEPEPHTPAARRSNTARPSPSAGESSGSNAADSADPFAPEPRTGGRSAGSAPPLTQLDGYLRAMHSQQPQQWDLAGLEQAYRQLHRASQISDGQLESRLAALEHYKQIRQRYDDFVRLTTETNQRESQLLALQQQQQEKLSQLDSPPAWLSRPNSSIAAPAPSPLPDFTIMPPNTQTAPNQTAPNQTVPNQVRPSPVPAGAGVPSGAAPTLQPHFVGTAQPALPQFPQGGTPGTWRQLPVHPQSMVQPQHPRFDGAGVIDRAATTYPGAPRHVLLAPDGRILAYLQAAAGVNLDAYRGQAVGVVGRRVFHPELQADLIQVRGLSPVRLQP